MDLERFSRWMTITIMAISTLLGMCQVQGVYEEFNMFQMCGKTIDFDNLTIIAGKLTLPYQYGGAEQVNCNVTVVPWSKWNRIAFEVSEYKFAEGACLYVGQMAKPSASSSQLPPIEPIMEVCGRRPLEERTPIDNTTDEHKNLVVAFKQGIDPSSFVLKFFSYHDAPCNFSIACDGDKCLSMSAKCNDDYFFGNCSATTHCEEPKPKKKSDEFKLTIPHIIGIVGACIVLLLVVILFCKFCVCKKGNQDETANVQLTKVNEDDSTPLKA